MVRRGSPAGRCLWRSQRPGLGAPRSRQALGLQPVEINPGATRVRVRTQGLRKWSSGAGNRILPGGLINGGPDRLPLRASRSSQGRPSARRQRAPRREGTFSTSATCRRRQPLGHAPGTGQTVCQAVPWRQGTDRVCFGSRERRRKLPCLASQTQGPGSGLVPRGTPGSRHSRAADLQPFELGAVR
jgi:hypothetical protein